MLVRKQKVLPVFVWDLMIILIKNHLAENVQKTWNKAVSIFWARKLAKWRENRM